MIGEVVEDALDQRLVGDAAFCSQPREERTAERVAGEDPVQVAASDAAVDADRAIGVAPRFANQIEHRPGEPPALGDAEMHLVAAYHCAAGDLAAGGLGGALLAA